MADGVSIPTNVTLNYDIEGTKFENGENVQVLGYLSGVSGYNDSGTATSGAAYTFAIEPGGLYELRFFDASVINGTPDNVYWVLSETASTAATADNDNLFPSSVIRVHRFRARSKQVSCSFLSTSSNVIITWFRIC